MNLRNFENKKPEEYRILNKNYLKNLENLQKYKQTWYFIKVFFILLNSYFYLLTFIQKSFSVIVFFLVTCYISNGLMYLKYISCSYFAYFCSCNTLLYLFKIQVHNISLFIYIYIYLYCFYNKMFVIDLNVNFNFFKNKSYNFFCYIST